MRTPGLVAALLLVIAGSASAQPGVLTRFRDTVTNKWGFKRDNGAVAIKPRFSGAGVFQNSRAPVEDDKGFAIIGRDGSILDRIREDSVAATKYPVPAPNKPCAGLRCYMEQLKRTGQVSGGEIQSSARDGESQRVASVWRFQSGAVAFDVESGDGGIITILLPGSRPDSAKKLADIIRPGVPPSTPGGGCQFELTSGAVKGGSYMKYRFGC